VFGERGVRGFSLACGGGIFAGGVEGMMIVSLKSRNWIVGRR